MQPYVGRRGRRGPRWGGGCRSWRRGELGRVDDDQAGIVGGDELGELGANGRVSGSSFAYDGVPPKAPTSAAATLGGSSRSVPVSPTGQFATSPCSEPPHALSRFETQARRDALASAPWVRRQLRELVASAAGADALCARADILTRTVEASERRAGGENRRPLDRPPPSTRSRHAPPARTFTETTRLLRRALGHDHDRGHGRGDDGLKLGR